MDLGGAGGELADDVGVLFLEETDGFLELLVRSLLELAWR